MPLLRQFFNLMPSRRAWAAQDKLPTEFLIDQYFNVPGVGLVVAGTLLSGAVHVNHELLMGPNNQGKFNKVTIKSIHHMRSPVPALLPGQTGAFVVRSRTKEHVRQLGIGKTLDDHGRYLQRLGGTQPDDLARALGDLRRDLDALSAL